MRKFLTISILSLVLHSCATIPKKATAVHPFNKEKYLGKWYEIARLDFKFEKNLNNTTAEYSLMKNGKIKVNNEGFNYKKNKWKQAIGKAKFRGEDTVAKLKVSFFYPFYAGYNVIAIDKDYQYALVAGKNTDYLWILSRSPYLPENIKNKYIEIAKKIGYNTADLIWVEHEKEMMLK